MFKKIFKSKNSESLKQIDNSKFDELIKTDFNSIEELIEQHAGLSFEKQLIFSDIIGDNAWELDMTKGKITFGNLAFPIQIIGSLSFNNNSWMWGWANTQSGMPENLLVQSNKLKEIGLNKEIVELTDEHYNVEEGFEHKVGMIACGLFNAKSYYCANYGQGTLVVTIDSEQIPKVEKEKIDKVLFNFPQLINGTELNHKNTFKNYLIDREFKLSVSDNKIEGLKNNKVVVAKFDGLNRLQSLNLKS